MTGTRTRVDFVVDDLRRAALIEPASPDRWFRRSLETRASPQTSE